MKFMRLQKPAHRLLLAAACLLLAAGYAGLHVKEERPNSVFVLGSLHDYMLDHPHYTLPVFVAAIERFRPDVILTEVRSDYPGPIDGSIDGGIEQSLVYAVGELQGFRVVPTDWFDDELIRALVSEELNSLSDPDLAIASKKYVELFKHASFSTLQGEETQALVRDIYRRQEMHGEMLSSTRNEHICQNISDQLAKLHGKRVLVVFGLDHKYFLEDCVRRHGDQVALPPDVSTTSSLPEDVRDRALSYVRASKAALKERLATGYYSTVYAERLKGKLPDFDEWIGTLSSN